MGRFMKYVVKQGETIQSIAQVTTGDAGNWIEIVMLNNLDDPFIDDGSSYSVSSNVKKPGDTILIPIDASTPDNVIPSEDFESIYEQALGLDISLFSQDPVRLVYADGGEVSADSKGDIGIVSGLQNLRQAIIIKLATPLGSLLRHPNFGTNLYQYLGKPNDVGSAYKVKTEIDRTIRADSRVSDVQFVKFDVNSNVASCEVQIQPIGFDVAFKLTLSFGTGGIIAWA